MKKLLKKILPKFIKKLLNRCLHFFTQGQEEQTKRKQIISSINIELDRAILIFPVIDWASRFQRPQHFATQFANGGYRVFYLSTQFNRSLHSGYLIKQLAQQVYEVRLCQPFSSKINLYHDKLNEKQIEFLKAGLAQFEQDCFIAERFIKIDHPFWGQITENLRGMKVYDCMDEHTDFDGIQHLETLENKLLKDVDLVVASSDKLFNRLEKPAKKIITIENACDYHFFNKNQINKNAEMLKASLGNRIIVGYIGAIASWFDVESVVYLAKNMPQYEFILIGSTATCTEVDKFKNLKNLQLLGEIPYIELPGYLAIFDVCLIPFKICPLTLATNPVKLFEYLSQGKPVLSVRLPEVEKYADVVYLANNQIEMLEQLQQAVKDKEDLQLIQARKNFAQDNSWEKRYNALRVELVAPKIDCPFISIVVLSYNNLHLTLKCLKSIEKYSCYSHYEIILVDNKSDPFTQEALAAYVKNNPLITLILNEVNYGFSKGNNIGIAAAKGSYIVLLNNDTFVSPYWLKGLLKPFTLYSKVGLTSPATNNIGNEAKIPLPEYFNELDFIRLANKNHYQHLDKILKSDRSIAFFCVMLKREVIEKVGFLDENFGRGWFEDDDYCLRMLKAGFETCIVYDVLVHHELSASFNLISRPDRDALFNKNKIYFEQKHNCKWKRHRQ